MARIAAIESDLDKKFKFDKKEDIIAAIETDLGRFRRLARERCLGIPFEDSSAAGLSHE